MNFRLGYAMGMQRSWHQGIAYRRRQTVQATGATSMATRLRDWLIYVKL